MASHLDFESKMPNGWSIQTIFGTIKDGTFYQEKADFSTLADLEILHLRLMQYFKDFQQLPVVGDFLIGDIDGFTVHQRLIDIKEKTIIFELV